MRYSIFSRKIIEVIRRDSQWLVFYPSNEGKKRNVEGLVIPSSIREGELEDYLADIFHEWATESNGEVKKM